MEPIIVVPSTHRAWELVDLVRPVANAIRNSENEHGYGQYAIKEALGNAAELRTQAILLFNAHADGDTLPQRELVMLSEACLMLRDLALHLYHNVQMPPYMRQWAHSEVTSINFLTKLVHQHYTVKV